MLISISFCGVVILFSQSSLTMPPGTVMFILTPLEVTLMVRIIIPVIIITIIIIINCYLLAFGFA